MMDYPINLLVQLASYEGRGNNAGSLLMSYIKINPRWLKNLNVKNKVVRGKKKRNIKKIFP